MTGITCWIHGRGRSYFDNVARQLRRQRVEEEAARRSAVSSGKFIYLVLTPRKGLQQGSVRIFILLGLIYLLLSESLS